MLKNMSLSNELKVNPFELKHECLSRQVYFNVGIFFPYFHKIFESVTIKLLGFYRNPSIKPYECWEQSVEVTDRTYCCLFYEFDFFSSIFRTCGVYI